MGNDWKKPEAKNRLFAATIASVDNKLNLKKIAELYGNGVTYDAVESQMRAVRKDAKALMDGSGREEIGQKRMIGDVDDEEDTETRKKIKIRIPRKSRNIKLETENDDKDKAMDSVEAGDEGDAS